MDTARTARMEHSHRDVWSAMDAIAARISRALAGLIALLPMFLVLPAVPPEGTLRLVIFDVGQGLA